jgi:PAS domain S-box-containing protein
LSPTPIDEKQEFEQLFNLPLDMICIAGTDGYFKRINPSFSRILGYDDNFLLMTPILQLIHPDDVERTRLLIDKLNIELTVQNFENRYRHQDGSYRIFSWSTSFDQLSKRLFAIARDITNERHYQSQLSQMHRVLNKETIVAMTNRAGDITEVNDKFCQISGYSKDELLGQNHRIINSGKHPKAFFKQMWDTISSGKTWAGKIENRAKNGEHYFVKTIISPIFDSQGNISNFLAIRFDITEEVRNKEMLSRTLDILRETGSIAHVGGWELHIASGILTWTDETFKILDVDPSDNHQPLLPEGLDLFVEEHKPIIEKAVQRAIDFGEPYELELQAQTAKGNTLWIYTTGKANYQNGQRISISGTIQDINTRKIAEQQLELERIKSIRNAKLASLGELAAGVAHEINNPLAIIDGMSKLIPKHLNNPEKLNSYLKSIEKSCSRISRIVDNLKKFSRSSDTSQYNKHRLLDIVKESILLTETKAKRHNTIIKLSASSKAFIFCDEIEIEQVVVNLINNAIDAVKDLPERWIKIYLLLEQDHIRLKIVDSGLGIPLAVQDKLFDPFFTTKKVGEGTGLGLSITKGILDEHGATLYIDRDEPNTCFVVSFSIFRD